jgi:hypothetical protein
MNVADLGYYKAQDDGVEGFKDNERDVFNRTQEGPEMPVEQAGSSSEQLVKGRFDPLSAAFLKQLPVEKQGRDLEAAVHQALQNGMNIFTYQSKFGYCVQCKSCQILCLRKQLNKDRIVCSSCRAKGVTTVMDDLVLMNIAM